MKLRHDVDWRFLPAKVLQEKDRLRHYVQRLGRGRRGLNSLGVTWSKFVWKELFSSNLRSGRVFVHVPRTSGYSIAQEVHGFRLPHYTAVELKQLFGDDWNRLWSFAVIRDPIDRLQSAYRFIIGGGTMCVAASVYDPAGLRKSSSFGKFVERLSDQRHLIRAYDVLRSQSSFVLDRNGRLLVDTLFPFRRNPSGHDELAAFLGIPPRKIVNGTSGQNYLVKDSTLREIWSLYEQDFILHRKVLSMSTGRCAALSVDKGKAGRLVPSNDPEGAPVVQI